MGVSAPNFIVGIGGSAGGLNAYKAFLDAMPSDTDMAFVIVCHLMPAANSQLAEILSRHTKMSVEVAATGMVVQRNHVYVISPNADLFIEKNNVLKAVSPRTKVPGRHKQVDLFLTSLAEAMGPRAIGIIFSGADGDGTEGCRLIKAKGGTIFVQDASAEVDSMPLGVRDSGSADFILPPEKIPAELLKIGNYFER